MKKGENGHKPEAPGSPGKPFPLPLIIAVVAVLSIITLLLLFPFTKQGAILKPGDKSFTGQSDTTTSRELEEGLEGDGTMIRSIRLTPPMPTRLDTLKVDVIPITPDDPDRFKYSYEWRVNNRIIEGAREDTLDLAEFQKRDLIAVKVTPYEGDRPGFSVKCQPVAIHSIPPSLELKGANYVLRNGQPIELQLISEHPDSEIVRFSLEEPLVAGMKIDEQKGRITWRIEPSQEGVIRFGTAVLDTEGTRVAKSFEINIGRLPTPATTTED